MNGLLRTFAALLGLLLATAGAAAAQDAESPAALAVPVEGELTTGTLALINRAAREVVELGARYLILDISSQRGSLDDIREVHEKLRALRSKDIYTIAYVGEFAWSSAALIALSCDRIYMGPKASLGAVTQLERSSFTNEQQVVAPEIRERIKQMLLDAIKDTPRDNPTTRLLLRAMADRDMQLFVVNYKDESGIEINNSVVEAAVLEKMRSDPKIEFGFPPPQEFASRPLTLTPEEGIQFGLVDSTVENFQLLVEERLQLESSQVVRMEESWSENLATFLNDMRAVLFVLGFILLLIELKTPGFALPGILGVIMFALAFFGAYTVGLANIGEILLFFLGLGLLATEIFFFPGTIVFAVAGFIAIVAGLILAQQPFVLPSTEAESDLMLSNFMNFGLILLVVMFAVWVIYANIHRVPILRTAVRFPPEPHPAGSSLGDAEQRFAQLLGGTGVLATDLRPTGWMAVGEERFDVVSEGNYIPKGRTVRVVEVRGNRIVVTEDTGGGDTGAAGGGGVGDGGVGDGGGSGDTGDAGTGDAGRSGESGEVHVAWLIMLVLIGLALVVAEVFFVSFGVLGTLSGVALITAVFLAFAHHNAWIGTTFLVTCAIGVPLVIKYAILLMPHTPFGRQLFLEGAKHDEVTGGAQQQGLEAFLHKTGVALCDLRPAGFARIEGRRVDVVTRGEMLEKDSPLKVVKVENNQVVVAYHDSQEPAPRQVNP